MRRKRDVRAEGMRGARQRHDGYVFARFEHTRGLAVIENRETLIVLSPQEIAVILGTVPFGDMTQAEIEAVSIVTAALRRRA